MAARVSRGQPPRQSRQMTYPFVSPPSDEAKLAAARPTGPARDLRTALIRGMPAIGIDGRAVIFDDEEFPLSEEEDERLTWIGSWVWL